MSFLDLAQPLIALGVRVFPLKPKSKEPALSQKWKDILTQDPAVVAQWDRDNPEYNIAMVCEHKTVCVLEFDVGGGLKKAATECGQQVPQTRMHVSGKGFAHCVFKSTEYSRRIGNRSATLPDFCNDPTCEKADHIHKHEFFSFRADMMYVVGPGSVHPNGNLYKVARDVEPLPIPNWLVDWILSKTPATVKSRERVSVDPEFDFNDFLDHYGITAYGPNEGWYTTDVCPVAGYRHEQSKHTGFYFDGETLGFKCFAQGCAGSEMSVGGVIKHLNQTHEPYPGNIWGEREEIDLDTLLADVDCLDSVVEPAVAAQVETALTAEELIASLDGLAKIEGEEQNVDEKVRQLLGIVFSNPAANAKQFMEHLDDLADIRDKIQDKELRRAFTLTRLYVDENEAVGSRDQIIGWLSADKTLSDERKAAYSAAVSSVENAKGSLDVVIQDILEIVDAEEDKMFSDVGKSPALTKNALYGWLGEMAQSLGTPIGYAYPALLAMFASRGLPEIMGVRPTVYVALMGPVGSGKGVTMKRGRKVIDIPTENFIDITPGSERGLFRTLGDAGGSKLLYMDEMKFMMSKIGIQGSGVALATSLCTLWSQDNDGGSDKHGTHPVNTKLSIIGGIPVKRDGSDFGDIFGSETLGGLHDRFIFGVYPEEWEYNDGWMPPNNSKLADSMEDIVDGDPNWNRPCYVGRYPMEVLQQANGWRRAKKGRDESGRLTENAKRIALITAAANGDVEVTPECMSAALWFVKWQERIREMYKPGQALNQDAACTSAIINRLSQPGMSNVKWSTLCRKYHWWEMFGSAMLQRSLRYLVEAGVVIASENSKTRVGGKIRMARRKPQ